MQDTSQIERDVAIVGAGPAGLSAAIALGAKGLHVIVLDEYFRAGGRLLGQRYEDPRKPVGERHWDGVRIARDLEVAAREAGVEIVLGATVWNIVRGPRWRLELAGAPYTSVTSLAMLIATGSAERSIPIPGWTLPGVMSIGAAQTFTNLHRIRPGNRMMVVGIDPLALSVAQEMRHAGVEVVGIALPPLGPWSGPAADPASVLGTLASVADLAPSLRLRLGTRLFGGRLRRIGVALGGLDILKVWGVPLHLRKAAVRISGTEQVEAVTLARVSGTGVRGAEDPPVPVDAVCISGGLYPLTDMVELAGCPLVDVPQLGGRVPLHSTAMATPIPGLYVAGNLAGVEAATVALAQGRVAGLAIALDLAGRSEHASVELTQALAEIERARAHAPLTFYPDSRAGRARLAHAWRDYEQERKTSASALPVR